MKTLSANTEENVFDFRYTPGEAPAPATETGTATATPGTPATPGAPAAPAAAAVAPAAEEGGEEVEVPDEEVPEDLVDLDEEDTPLANKSLDETERPGTRMSYLPIYIAIGAAAVAGLCVTAVYLKKRRKASVTPEELLENIRDDE